MTLALVIPGGRVAGCCGGEMSSARRSICALKGVYGLTVYCCVSAVTSFYAAASAEHLLEGDVINLGEDVVLHLLAADPLD